MGGGAGRAAKDGGAAPTCLAIIDPATRCVVALEPTAPLDDVRAVMARPPTGPAQCLSWGRLRREEIHELISYDVISRSDHVEHLLEAHPPERATWTIFTPSWS